MNKVAITGCAGFIGSHAVDLYLGESYNVLGIDSFTYAANEKNLENAKRNRNFTLLKGDICDYELMKDAITEVDWVINFAAETHVDNSIGECDSFIYSNVTGVKTLLEVCKENGKQLLHVSTDEVYGSTMEGSISETGYLDPKNPYSATKAAGEHLVRAYSNTYGLEHIIVRPSNNFGPRQHVEKFLPTIVRSLKLGKKIPVYGTGNNVRDWLYVKDNVAAILYIMKNSKLNETYNITRKNELTNNDICHKVCEILGKDPHKCIEYVTDRLGHDFRYSITNDKLKHLGFSSSVLFDDALTHTVQNLWDDFNDI